MITNFLLEDYKNFPQVREFGEDSTRFIREEMERTWQQSHLAVLSKDESQSWLLGVITACFLNWLMFNFIYYPLFLQIALNLIFPFFFQSLWLLRLSAELEGWAAALRSEALQHMTIVLAGVDCKDLWRVLMTFFGSNWEEDPFQFLDGAPLIKRPLDLTDTESEDDTSDPPGMFDLGDRSNSELLVELKLELNSSEQPVWSMLAITGSIEK